MYLLITRPAAASAKLAAQLQARGHRTRIEPLLTLMPRPQGLEDIAQKAGNCAAAAFTSAHALTLTAALLPSALPIYTVGTATKDQALSLGFGKVTAAKGQLTSLAQTIAQKHRSRSPLLYPRARIVSADLAPLLAPYHIPVMSVIVYQMKEKKNLSRESQHALMRGDINGIILTSKHSLCVLRRLLIKAQISLTHVTLFCLSQAIAQDASDLAPTRACSEPNQSSLLEDISIFCSHETSAQH